MRRKKDEGRRELTFFVFAGRSGGGGRGGGRGGKFGGNKDYRSKGGDRDHGGRYGGN